MFPLLTTPFRALTKGLKASLPPVTVHLSTESSTESHMSRCAFGSCLVVFPLLGQMEAGPGWCLGCWVSLMLWELAMVLSAHV